MLQTEDGCINVFLDGPDVTLGDAFVSIRRGETKAKGMLSPEFGGRVD